MQRILAKKTVSLTDLRDPKKVLEFAGDEPVAIMNRNKVVGYFTPVASVADTTTNYDEGEVVNLAKKVTAEHADALDYLKDK